MANQICKYCSGCGFKVGVPIYSSPVYFSTTGTTPQVSDAIKCKACDGTGWIDDEKKINVPIKFVKEEYFKNFNQ